MINSDKPIDLHTSFHSDSNITKDDKSCKYIKYSNAQHNVNEPKEVKLGKSSTLLDSNIESNTQKIEGKERRHKKRKCIFGRRKHGVLNKKA